MDQQTESKATPKQATEHLDRKIEGELTLDELNAVVGGVSAGPIYNGSYFPRFKSRFGVD